MRSYVKKKKKCEWRTFGDFKHGRLEGRGQRCGLKYRRCLALSAASGGARRICRSTHTSKHPLPPKRTACETFSASPASKKQQYSLVASGGGISGPIWRSGWTTQESINQIDSPSNSPVCSLDLMRTSVKTRFFSLQKRHLSLTGPVPVRTEVFNRVELLFEPQKNGRSGRIRGGVVSWLRNTIYCFSLTRKENTSMLPSANQRSSTSGTPRPLEYMKGSALSSSGHWHNKDSGSARRINFFFDFSLYFLRGNNGRHTGWLRLGYLCQGPEGEEAGRGEGERQRCCHQRKGERGERRA